MIIKKVKKVIFDSILGLAIYPIIFLKKDYVEELEKTKLGHFRYTILLNHEKIHLAQEKEMLVLPFYIWYGIEWCLKSVKYGSWAISYRNISFEREAYTNETDLNYLENRKFFTFLKYI